MKQTESNPKSKSGLIDLALFAFLARCFLAYVARGLVMLRYTGLQYDETLFVNAATGNRIGLPASHFISARLHGIPILLMDYIGALKAWFYLLVFRIFGVSKFTIRAPMVILTPISIGIMASVVKPLARKFEAFL